MTDMSKSFTIIRTFEATPEEVWRAWTDPDETAQWWPNTPRESVEIDARVGGRYIYAMVNEETDDRIVTGGVYRDVQPFERLVFTWGKPDDDPDDAPVVTVTLEPIDSGTRMTFELRGVEGVKGDRFFYDGWDNAFDTLGAHLVQS